MIVIFHLSDIHFKSHKDRVYRRAQKIASTVNQFAEVIELCLIVVSGDIANSGLGSEYVVAESFLNDIKKAIAANGNVQQVRIVVAPGNHDCDFSGDTEARELLLKQIAANSDQVRGNGVIGPCVEPQEAFFKFVERIEGTSTLSLGDRLCRQVPIDVGGVRLLVVVYNTAWVSSQKEKAGDLSFPPAADSSPSLDTDLVMSVFHHPTAWLAPNNAAMFRERIESTSDIILTGHEHRPGTHEKLRTDGTRNEYFEGGALQPHTGIPTSHFNVVCLDFEKRARKILHYEWDSGNYKRSDSLGWLPFIRGSQMLSGIQLAPSFVGALQEPGAQFTHPAKGSVLLQDIFVYPKLREVIPLRGQATVRSGKDLPKHLGKTNRVLIYGDDQAGKTAYARILYRDLRAADLVPVLLQGEDLISSEPEAVLGKIREACERQYTTDVDVLFRLAPTLRVLIIDDLHKCPLTRDERRKLNAVLDRWAGSTIMFGGDLLRFEELSEDGGGDSPLLHVQRYELMPFGHELRNELIAQWHAIGRERGTEDELLRRVRRSEGIVTTVIGNQVVPSFPIFILILMQQEEAARGSEGMNSSGGSYGHFREFLITRAVAAARSVDDPDLDTCYQYLSELAYELFSSEKKSLSFEEFSGFHRRYSTEYSLDLTEERIRGLLLRAGMLKVDIARYSFKYPYGYYYFVARALSLDAQRFSRHIEPLVDRIYKDDSANIVIYLAHLERDRFVIAIMLDRARAIYADVLPCDMEHHVKFIEAMGVAPRALALPSTPPSDNRRRLLKARDEREPAPPALSDAERDAEQRELNASLQLNVALKTMAVLGQILRNFPGSLKGERKVEIARECYLLGMRTLAAFLGMMETHRERIQGELTQILEQYSFDELELKDRVRGALYWLAEMLAFGLVQRTADAVGLYKLSRTYDEIVAGDDTLAIAMIDVAVRLDHLVSFPENEVRRVSERTAKLPFARGILSLFVHRHFYLYESDIRLRQQVCALLGIRMPTRTSTMPELTRVT